MLNSFAYTMIIAQLLRSPGEGRPTSWTHNDKVPNKTLTYTVSSVAKPQNHYRFGPSHLYASNLTSWCSNSYDHFHHPWIEVRFNQPTPIHQIIIGNGDTLKSQTYFQHERLKTFKLNTANSTQYFTLKDTRKLQVIKLPQSELVRSIKLTFEKTYPALVPKKYAQVCLHYFQIK